MVLGYDDNDRLDEDTYDANGNTVAGIIEEPIATNSTAFTYSYDFENRIIAATSSAYTVSLVYDGDGNRVQKILTPNVGSPVTTTFLVDDRNPSGYAQVLEEISTTLAATTTVHYALGLDLISQTRVTPFTNATSFYGYDGHGNVRFLTDESGQITDRYDYDAWGSVIDRAGSTQNHYLYCGEQFDESLGLYFLRARYLDPDRGRFLTMDSFSGFQRMPFSLNKYLYANGNGVSFVDPSGHFTLVEIMVVVFLIGTMNAIAVPSAQTVAMDARRAHAEDFRAHVIRGSLSFFILEGGAGWAGDAAEELLLGTAITESRLQYRVQKNKKGEPVQGGGRGLYQMQSNGLEETFKRLHRTYPELESAILGFFSEAAPADSTTPIKITADRLMHDDPLATVMARAYYLVIGGDLPPAGNLQAQASFYKTHWNRSGSGSAKDYINDWHEFGLK